MILWRISNHADLLGMGGKYQEGRWHTAAERKRILYTSEHPALALVEALANLSGDPRFFPDAFQLLKLDVPDQLACNAVPESSLPQGWRDQPNQTQQIGDDWLSRAETPLLAVPAAPSPESTNFLINPLHRASAEVRVLSSQRVLYDQRLFHLQEIPHA